MSERIRDRVWIWGHPQHSLVAEFDLDGNMSPKDGMDFFGAKNIFYVPMRNKVDRNSCCVEMKDVDHVGWSIENSEQAEELIGLSGEFSNITCGVFDDFFNQGTKGSYENYSTEDILRIKEKLHKASRPLDVWLVYYTMNIDEKVVKKYMPLFDGVILWFWHATDNNVFEEKVKDFILRTENQRRMVGCYLYDFGNKKEIDPQIVEFQLNRAKEMLKQGLIEGFVLHTNGVADLGYAAVDTAKKWMEKNGDETL